MFCLSLRGRADGDLAGLIERVLPISQRTNVTNHGTFILTVAVLISQEFLLSDHAGNTDTN